MSRLTRDAGESIRIYQEFRVLGIAIISVTDGIDTTQDSAKFPFYFKSISNEFFVDDLKKRVHRGMRGQIERGYSAGGRMYGYTYTRIEDPSGEKDRHGRVRGLGVKVSFNNSEAVVVRRIFDLGSQGIGVRSIARLLNDENVPAPHARTKSRSGLWSQSSIHSMLRNRKYIGDWTWNKRKSFKQPGTSRRKFIHNPESEWVVICREDLRIIDKAIWDAAEARRKACGRKLLDGNRKLVGCGGQRRGAKYLLSGLLQCGECKGNLIAISSHKYSSYVCNNHWSRGDKACTNAVRINRRRLEEAVVDCLSKKLLDPILIKQIQAEVERELDRLTNAPRKDASISRIELERHRQELENLIAFVKAGDTSEAIRAEIAKSESAIARLEAQLTISGDNIAIARRELSSKAIEQSIRSLGTTLTASHTKLPLIQTELRALLDGKIVLSPEDMGDMIAIKGLIGARVGDYLVGPRSVMVHSGTGNRTPAWWLRTTCPNH